jgi:AcrR family transcriptional regulator
MPEIQAAPPLRADARRNRDALLVAAREVFAEHGLDAPLDAIAKQAGVGRATLYRRFPTRDDLIAAIFDDDLGALRDVVSEASDPTRAYFDFLDAAVQLQCENLGFIELFTRRQPEAEMLREIGVRFQAIVAEPLRAAQAAGLVRPDLSADDTGTILLMIGAANANYRGWADGDERRKRALAIILDGIDPKRAPRTLPAVD